MDTKLKIAKEEYEKGYTCSQAVFNAYVKDIGIEETTACRMMEGFGGGIGGMQEVCGALSAASAIISYYCSKGTPEGKQETYRVVRKAMERFQHEYGGVTCKAILRGKRPQAFQCSMKVKDTVLIIENILHEEKLR